MERITGAVIAKKILDFLEGKGIPVEKCVGQCYDGAPNMQSEKKGVASYILARAPQGGVTHCNSHNLNLVISTAAKLPIVDNALEQLKAIQIFFNTSPKRESLLTHIVDKDCFKCFVRNVQDQMVQKRHFLRTLLPCNASYGRGITNYDWDSS